MIDNNGSMSERDKLQASATAGDGIRGSDATTDLSTIGKETGTTSPNIAAESSKQTPEEISAENLLSVIETEWKNEFVRIKDLGLNGFKRRKESKNDSLV